MSQIIIRTMNRLSLMSGFLRVFFREVEMSLEIEALDMLESTSRTFFIPISRLPPGLLDF